MIRPALERLSDAGVPYTTRGEQPIDDPPHGGDVDLLVSSADVDAADRVLRAAGFRRLAVRGRAGHRFYLDFDAPRGRWLKIDLNIVPAGLGWDLHARDADSLSRFGGYRVGEKGSPGPLERLRSAVARRGPLGVRRAGPVIAVLGPDGAGKGTVIAALQSRVPAAVTPVYLGQGNSRGSYGGEQRSRPRTGSRGPARDAVRALLGLLPEDMRKNQHRLRKMAAGLPRLWGAYARAWRGDIVVCDRHPLDDLALGPPGRGAFRSFELWLLRRFVPWPDAVIVLDAPGEILFERKGEHSPAVLERWRESYRRVFEPRGALILPTQGELDDTVTKASAVLWHALSDRRRW